MSKSVRYDTYSILKSQEEYDWEQFALRSANRQRNLRIAKLERAAKAAAEGNVRNAWVESRNAQTLRAAFEKAGKA